MDVHGPFSFLIDYVLDHDVILVLSFQVENKCKYSVFRRVNHNSVSLAVLECTRSAFNAVYTR